MKNNLVVEYKKVEAGQSQYDVYDYDDCKVVDACYVRSKYPHCLGNPLIEALPVSFPDDVRIFEKGLEGYDYSLVKDMDCYDRAIYAFSIRDLRFILPFHKEIFLRFKATIIDSYSKRYITFINGKPKTVYVEGKETTLECVTDTSASEGISGGFSLCGKSGTGKSSAMHLVLSQFPQLIKHKLKNGGYFYQLVYIFVQCSPNSNFQGLFKSICVAIDKALGNYEPFYSVVVDKQRGGIAGRRNYVRSLIETFGIGAIIIDECQLMNFDHIMDSSYDSLMVLANETKVAIIPVGTQEARKKMFKEYKNARRIGSPINSDICCNDRIIFNINMCKLFRYQFTSVYTKIKGPKKTSQGIVFDNTTTKLADAFYLMSKGIIAQMVSLYLMCQYEAILCDRKTPIDAKFVINIAGKYYPNIIPLLDDMETEENLKKYEEESEECFIREDMLLDELKQKQNSKEIADNIDGKDDFLLDMLNRIIGTINSVTDEYSKSDIKRVFYKIVDGKNVAENDESKLLREVFSGLKVQALNEQKKRDLNKCSPEALRKYVGVDK